MDYYQEYIMAANEIAKQQIINKPSNEIAKFTPPIAKKIPYINHYHHDKITDNYHWLRDNNWPNIQNSDILNYLKAENDYTSSIMSQYKNIEDKLFQEIIGRIKLADISVPVKKDNYYYYAKTNEDSNHHIFCRKYDSLSMEEEIILDANELAKGFEYFNLGGLSINPDHMKMAYATDTSGAERYTITVKDLQNKKLLKDIIIDTAGNAVWHEDGQGFFYEKLNEHWRSQEIYYHKLGTASDEDLLIFKEQDPRFSVGVGKSADKNYIFIDTHSSDSNETWLISMNDKTMTPKLILKRKEDHLYDVDHGNNKFYIRTNDMGKNFRLVAVENENFSKENWQEIVPFNKNIYLTDFSLYKGYIAIETVEIGLPQIKILDLSTNKLKVINFQDPTYEAGVIFTTYDDSALRYNYSSLNTPNSTIEYDFKNKTTSILKEQEVLGGYDKNAYKSERVFAISKDGTKIPISLVYKKELFNHNGSNPLYLYGYGSYGHAISPSFRSSIVSLLDRGFVYAIAHIRGGDDMGYEWYENGKLLNKRNSFNDFIASSKYLIDNHYSSKNNIVIAGGSAGGMLMGVCVNEHPDLYKAAVMHVPFVDVLNTMYDETLPLTPGEFKEWGNPRDLTYYEYIKSYSPYDNIKLQTYPSMYVTASISDPRVTYWEPAKWVAKLRDFKKDNNWLLLETNMDAGHAGASGRFGNYREIAKEYNFILQVFGL